MLTINGRGAINGRGTINGRGAINGMGQTNGVHFVNGIGAVNGKDLVNGTGASNGLGARRRGRGSRRRLPIYMRWQFIAVLIAVAIIVPSYLHISDIGDDGPYSVDGEFDDWEEASMFSVTSATTGVPADVAEWSFATYSHDVYFYVHATSNLMMGTDAQRFVWFIDQDSSPGGIGADYMIEVFGWNDSVQSSILSAYDPDGDDQADWNSWATAGYVPCNVADYISTKEALKYPGLEETNPLMKPFVKSPAAFAAIKFGTTALSYLSMKAIFKRNRTVAWIMTTASNALLSYVVANNMRLIQGARAR